MMVVFALGSDSGFGIGTDGIVDDYDDETGISVILWCVIFVFLLVVTVWFYITQLMPATSTKCEVDDEDEEERVANRLFDQLGAKSALNNYKESPNVQPSTSSENTDDYEVIDAEIRIHYSNYERGAEDAANSNETGPREASTTTILRRPSMEEMSLIFPGFLPSISEEDEEECEKSAEERNSEIQREDVYKSSVNSFIQHEDSTEKHSFDRDEPRQEQSYSEGDVRVITNRKGKQPAASCSTELRQRTYHYDPQHSKTTYKGTRHARDNNDKTAVLGEYHNADEISNSSQHHYHGCQNIEPSNTFISGSENSCDPKKQNNDSNATCPGPLIIGKIQRVTQETLSPVDANEKINGLDLERIDATSALAKSNLTVKNDVDEDLVYLENSTGILREVKADIFNEKDQRGDVEKILTTGKNGVMLSQSGVQKCLSNMTGPLTHAWTFYTMSEHTGDLNGSLEGGYRSENYDQQSEVPRIMIDLYKSDKRDDLQHKSVGQISWSRLDDSMDSFETDIDVDEVNLDELDVSKSTDNRLDCFFKRHVSVTDLDKILSSSEIPNDESEQCQNDIEDFDREITAPVDNTNKHYDIERDLEDKNTATTGGRSALNRAPTESQCEITRQFIYTQNKLLEHVSDNSESETTGKEFNDGEIKTARIIQLTSAPRNSNAKFVVDSAEDIAEVKQDSPKSEKLCNCDLSIDNVNNYSLEQLDQVENILNNNTKTTDNHFKSKDNIQPGESKMKARERVNFVGTDIVDLDQRSMTSRVCASKISAKAGHANSSNVKNIEEEKGTLKPDIALGDNIQKSSHDGLRKDQVNKQSSTYKPIKKDPIEEKTGLTAAELSGKIYSSKDEVIFGRRKLKKDSLSKSYTNGSSRFPIGSKEKSGLPTVAQYPEIKEPEMNRKTDKANRSDLTEHKTIIATEKTPKSSERCMQEGADLPSKRRHDQMQTLPLTIEKSVSDLIPEKSKLACETVPCMVSISREINWNEFSFDGALLEEVRPSKTATVKPNIDFCKDDILLPSIDPRRQPVIPEIATQINENVISETMCSRRIDWQWFDKKLSGDPINKRAPIDNDDETPETTYSNRLEEKGAKIKNATEKNALKDTNSKENCVRISESVTAEDKSESNEKESTGGQVNELHVAMKESEENLHSLDDVFVDNPSEASLPSSEPEFPVRLTKSFSELRTIERMNQLPIVEPQFPENKPDRSKSQTDVFEPQDSKDEEIVETTGEQVFKTTITVDEVYANKRRIVILNVRKKTPGKNRWKSLNDLQTTPARKHVYRFKSIGSQPKELNQTAGEDEVASRPKESTKETMFAVSRSVPDLHDNAVTSRTSPPPTSKASHLPTSMKAVDNLTEQTNENIVLESCIQHKHSDSEAEPSFGTNIGHSSVEVDIPTKVNDSIPRSHSYTCESQGENTSETPYITTSFNEENLTDEHDPYMFSGNRPSQIPMTDSPKSLPSQTSLPLVDDTSVDQKSTFANQVPSSGAIFADSRQSPQLLAESASPRRQSPERQDPLSPNHDLNQEVSIASVAYSGTMFAVSRHSPTPLAASWVERSPPRQASFSLVEDLTKQSQDSVPSSGTLFAVSRHSPTPIINSPVIESVISETLMSRELDWQFLKQNLCEESEPKEDTATTDTNLEKCHSQDKNTAPVDSRYRNPIAIANYNFQKGDDRKPAPKSNEPNLIRVRSSVPPTLVSEVRRVSPSMPSSSKEKRYEERALQRQSSLSPELKLSNRSSSRCSSASSGSLCGTSRISPNIDDKTLRPSPELISVVNNSSGSSGAGFAAIRISPTPSMESECSNAEENGLQRKSSLTRRDRGQRRSYRSGTVFAVSGYSSAASDTESRRSDSTSPTEIESKRPSIYIEKGAEAVHRETRKMEKEKSEVSSTITVRGAGIPLDSVMQNGQRNDSPDKSTSRGVAQEINTRPNSNANPPSWQEKVKENRTSHREVKKNRQVMVTDLDSLLSETNSTATEYTDVKLAQTFETSVNMKEEKTSLSTIKVQSVGASVTNDRKMAAAAKKTSSRLQETDLDAVFFEKMNSSSKSVKREETSYSRSSVKSDSSQRSIIHVTSSTIGVTPVPMSSQDALLPKGGTCNESPVFDDLDDEVFTNTSRKATNPKRSEASCSSDADSETSSLSSIPIKHKSRHTRGSLEAARTTPPKSPSQSSNSSSIVTPGKDDPELKSFFPPSSTSTPEEESSVVITRKANSMSRETAKEPGQSVRHVNAQGTILLKDFSYEAPLTKARSHSESRTISTEIQRSAFTAVRSCTKDGRSVSQEYILEGITAHPKTSPKKTLNHNNGLEGPTFKDMADSHKSMPDLHNLHEEIEVDRKSPSAAPHLSRLNTHTRLWLSQTAGIDTSDLCKADETGGSEIFLFPSNRFQPGKNVDASFLSLASETEDIPDDVSTRPSSPMSEFSFAGESPFGGEYKDELNIISCGHNYCGNEEVLRGQEKTSFTSCPSCFTYYCSRECRQAHWTEHKKWCYFGRINSYMRSFIYFCHKKENLKLLLSKIATKNYPSKGRGCVMVTFASPQQARKFMTGGCVLLPSPPSYSPLRNLMREGVVSKHKVNLVQQVKDYDPSREFVLNLAVVAGRLEDLPRHPAPRHKLNTVLQCIKIPLSDSLIEHQKTTALDTSQETRMFYLPKCSRHEFVNDMEARRHYCRNISKGLKQYGIRLKKDYPEAYDSLCMYVEKNVPFKPLTVYGNQNSKIVACRIMPEGSSSAV